MAVLFPPAFCTQVVMACWTAAGFAAGGGAEACWLRAMVTAAPSSPAIPAALPAPPKPPALDPGNASATAAQPGAQLGALGRAGAHRRVADLDGLVQPVDVVGGLGLCRRGVGGQHEGGGQRHAVADNDHGLDHSPKFSEAWRMQEGRTGALPRLGASKKGRDFSRPSIFGSVDRRAAFLARKAESRR